MTPTKMAEIAGEIARQSGLEFYVIDRAKAKELGMGAFLGVAQGSDEPPAMIVMRYWGAGKEADPGLGLVGKAITFDSGGISIKPSENMQDMKDDMSGGAATIAAMQAIAQLKPRINVTGIVPATENMPSGKSYKPGDILKAMNGKTIEVVNTDAEGRLVLADAIAYATQTLKLSPVVDAATLTGAMNIALGNHRTGLFSNNQALSDLLFQIGEATGERNWVMPMDDEYAEQIKSDWADLKNSGGRPAGSITAAWFIRNFCGETPWAHLDIAGSINRPKETGYLNKFGNGTPTRTFINLALELAKKK
jgi:leucyl aminopeptidase